MSNILKEGMIGIIGFWGGVIFMIYLCGYILEARTKKADRFYAYFNLLDHWLTYKEHNYQFVNFFCENHIKSVAIYRMGKMGSHLKYELNKLGIPIKYVIDDGESVIYGKEIHYSVREKLPFVDVVIVTSIDEYDEIKNKIIQNNKMLKVISLEDIFD